MEYSIGMVNWDKYVRKLFGHINRRAVREPVWSFDIDLTIQLPEDVLGCEGAIPIERLKELQAYGYVVGTCSDRAPSDQWEIMVALGFYPNFCISKEELHIAALSLDYHIIHVGDDEQRDKMIATNAGCDFLWPYELEQYILLNSLDKTVG